MTPAVQDASCAAGAFLCRGSEALPSGSYPPSKKEYFLTATPPQALARGVSAQLVQKPRRVSPPERRKVRSFSSATCAAKKILLRLQVWNLCALGAQIMRAADCSPFVKKEYFLTAATPQALAHGVSAQLVQKPRRVSPPQRRKKVRSFSSATCAAKKIPLGLQTCALFASGGQRVRCSRPQTLSSKKEYFLTATTPQALARGVSAQLVQKPRRVSPPQRRKKVKSFSQATCAAEKILLRLQVWNLRAAGAQIMRAADCSPFVKK